MEDQTLGGETPEEDREAGTTGQEEPETEAEREIRVRCGLVCSGARKLGILCSIESFGEGFRVTWLDPMTRFVIPCPPGPTKPSALDLACGELAIYLTS